MMSKHRECKPVEETIMKIWIDADGCPGVIKQLIFRASERLNIPVCLVANRVLRVPSSPLITTVHVAQGFDKADSYIVQEVAPDDLVITADLPLAADIVAQGAMAINPRGEVYTEENIGERLAVRNLMQELRSSGLIRGGPAQLGAADRQKFAAALDKLLTKRLQS
jgi:uncharacterized protein YaiI (UPF0178 family)